MSVSITILKNSLGRKFRGASLDDVQGISNWTVFGEAANNLLSAIDPYETVRHSGLNLFQDVNDYTPPADLKSKKVIDIRKQVRRQDDFRQTFTEDFDRDKEEETFSIEFDEGAKLLRVERDVSNSTDVTDLESGNWSGSGATSITEDTILYADNSAGKSIRFDVTTGFPYLEWNGTAIDLSDHTNKSSFFMWVYYPDATAVSGVTLRVGLSAAAYYQMAGQIHKGSKRTGWNLYRFDWNGATETGSVDEENIDYVQVKFTVLVADTDLRIGRLSSKLPSPYEVVYYSNCLFTDSTGTTFKTIPTSDDDLLLLEKEAENIFFYECCSIIAEDLQRDPDASKFKKKLSGDPEKPNDGGGLYGQYKTDKPTEKIRPQSRYYRTPIKRNSRTK